MNIVLAAILTLTVPPAAAETSATRTTRLFVRTIPDGAAVTLDGKAIGKTDGLFVISPGDHDLTLELEGYRSQTRKFRAPEGRITRIEVKLQGADQTDSGRDRPDPTPPTSLSGDAQSASGTHRLPQGADGAGIASVFVSEGDFAGSTRQAMLTVLRQHPNEIRWSGRDDNLLFGIAIKPLPQGDSRQRAVPAMLELVQMLAVHEMLKAKSLLDRYAAAGLTDATTLRQAVETAAGQLHVTGKAKGVVQQAAVRNGLAVAYIVAPQADLTAYLLQATELEKVRTAYRDVMHRQARDLMARSNWADALLLWQHLHQRQLVSQQLYLDAARCFQQLNQTNDAVRVLREAIEAFAKSGNAGFFEQAGDIALEIPGEPAQALAEQAYQRAIDTLRETVSGPDGQQPSPPVNSAAPAADKSQGNSTH